MELTSNERYSPPDVHSSSVPMGHGWLLMQPVDASPHDDPQKFLVAKANGSDEVASRINGRTADGDDIICCRASLFNRLARLPS